MLTAGRVLPSAAREVSSFGASANWLGARGAATGTLVFRGDRAPWS